MSQRRSRAPFRRPVFRLVIHSAIVIATVVAAGTLASAQSSLPEVHGLRFEPQDKQTLAWDATLAPAGYALWMGTSPASGDHECLLTQIEGLSAVSTERPEPGRLLYFLVTSQDYELPDRYIVNGPFGDSGHPRPTDRVACGARVFVDPDAVGTGNGSSWADAYTSVARVLEHPQRFRQWTDAWLVGPIDEEVTLEDRPSVRLYGGFQGHETAFDERSADANPTDWFGDALSYSDYLADGKMRLVLDGFRFHGCVYQALSTGNEISLANSVVLDCGISISGPSDYFGGQIVRIDKSRMSCAGSCLHIASEGDYFDVRIEDSVLEARDGDAVVIDLADGIMGAHGNLSIRSGTFKASRDCLRVNARSWTVGSQRDGVRVSASIGSSVFDNCGRDAAALIIEPYSRPARMTSDIATNTFASAGDAAIRLRIDGDCKDAFPEPCDGATNVASIRDNVFYMGGGHAVSESLQDDPGGYSADATLIGNDFYGNLSMLLDEGLSNLATTAEVNAIENNAANFSLNPEFVSPALGDFHLTPFSPLIDRCTSPAPPWLPHDMDGQPRTRAVFDFSNPRCDVGGDEY